MKTIPKKNQLVMFNGKLHRVITCNLGGKCTLKKFSTTNRSLPLIKDIDISELTEVNS